MFTLMFARKQSSYCFNCPVCDPSVSVDVCTVCDTAGLRENALRDGEKGTCARWEQDENGMGGAGGGGALCIPINQAARLLHLGATDFCKHTAADKGPRGLVQHRRHH